MTPKTINGLAHDQALKFSREARKAARLHYSNGLPPIIREKLKALREAAETFERVAEDAAAMLLAEEVPGVDGDWYDVAITVDAKARGNGIAER
jgi:hypothetical protein